MTVSLEASLEVSPPNGGSLQNYCELWNSWQEELPKGMLFPRVFGPGTDGSHCSVAVMPLGLASCAAGFELMSYFGGDVPCKTSTAHDQAAAA